jgi:signal transduction histidine kinase
MIASDRMSTLGQMIAGIAHELKTPNAAAANSLARVKALSSELSKSIGHAEVTDADLREIAAELAAASELAIRGTERVGRFLQALRSQTLGMHETNVVPFRILERVGNALALLEHKAGRAGIRVETAGDSTIGVTGDPSKFEQVITNLVLNALDAIEEAGAGSLVRVSVDLRGEGVRVVVEDDGPGIPAALREQVFEPLFTTRAAHGGTGLGLSICRDVIEGAFGGKLHLAAAPSGARFEIFLPDGGSVAASHRQFAPGSAQAS